MHHNSSGSDGQVTGAEKHENYAATFGSHLFYDLFSQGQGGMAPSAPLDPLLHNSICCKIQDKLSLFPTTQMKPTFSRMFRNKLFSLSIYFWSKDEQIQNILYLHMFMTEVVTFRPVEF